MTLTTKRRAVLVALSDGEVRPLAHLDATSMRWAWLEGLILSEDDAPHVSERVWMLTTKGEKVLEADQ